MGQAMASNLQRHLATKKALSLIYSNRTMARGAPLQSLGGVPEPSFEKLVSKCGIIFTMVIHRDIGVKDGANDARSQMTQSCKAFYLAP